MSVDECEGNNSFSNMQETLSEFEQLEPNDVLTANEILENIKIYDSTM